MNKLILFFVVGVVVILIGWSMVPMKSLQTPDGIMKDEIVQVSGGSYRNIASEQLWTMLQKKDFVLRMAAEGLSASEQALSAGRVAFTCSPGDFLYLSNLQYFHLVHVDSFDYLSGFWFKFVK